MQLIVRLQTIGHKLRTKLEFFYHVPLYIVMCENKDFIKYNANNI